MCNFYQETSKERKSKGHYRKEITPRLYVCIAWMMGNIERVMLRYAVQPITKYLVAVCTELLMQPA